MARYFLRFRHSDIGLFPTFGPTGFFKRAVDLVDQTAPTIIELGKGTYYFDYMPATDIIFEADGGATITDQEIRYISDTISPKDSYVDEPMSQVKDDVWDDVVDRGVGTKGNIVETLNTDITAVKAKTDNLPADPAGTATTLTNINAARDSVKGAALLDLSLIGGTGFNTATDSLKVTGKRVLKALGINHENSVLDQTAFTPENNLLNGRLRLYNTKANADAAVAASPGVYDTGKIAEYSILATYTGANLKTYKVSREA